MEEVSVKGFEGLYTVTTEGDVYSLNFKNKFKLKPRKNQYGYLTVGLYKNGKNHNKTIHRIVANSFIPNPENKPTVNHKDCVKTNNKSKNLEWATVKENTIHSWENKRSKYTPSLLRSINTSKKCRMFTPEQEEAIRKRHLNGEMQKDIAAELGCNRATIGNIINRKHKINP